MATEEKYVRFSTRGGSAPGYMGVTAHPQAVVAYRPDAPNNVKMIENGFMSEAFEKDKNELSMCGNADCVGLFFFNNTSDWDQHVHYRHTARPGSPLSELQAQAAGKIAAHDQAVETERDARLQREALEEEVKTLKKELTEMEQPKAVPVNAKK